jgi:uncharacterized protein (TIGR04141 family)
LTAPRTAFRCAGGSGYQPKKVVFAILMENGAELSIDTLYPFSQVTLAHVARVLGTYGIDVEVIGIPAA